MGVSAKQKLLDEKYMKMAIALARKGMGKTSPNPAVGAVLVKDKKIIATGYHKTAGSSHAEVAAIEKAGKNARGATLYCTLEACAHYGKTPPCAKKIIKSGIKKAVFAMKDPNPINRGRGIAELKKAGLSTKCGLLKKEASQLNRPFTKFIKKGIPYITLKMAQSMDGKIADSKGRSKWISSKRSRRLVHKMRAENDAVLIGVNTLIKDDPLLTSRVDARGDIQRFRIILDTNLRTPLGRRIFRGDKSARSTVLIIGGIGASPKKKALLEKRGVEVILLPRKDNRINLLRLMRYLTSRNINSVLCEGGGELSASLVKNMFVDEVFFFISPCIIGGRVSPTSCDGPYSDIRNSVKLKDISVKRLGSDILIRGRL